MPQQGTSGIPPERPNDETVAPQNPPNSVARPAVRRATLATVLGGIIIAVMLAAGAFVYVTAIDRGDGADVTDPSAVGTSGERMPREGTPGGFDPAPSLDGTRDELEYRGGAANSVSLEGVEVELADGATFWVRDGDTSVQVTAPGGMPTVRPGQRVDITGTTDRDGNIRASRIDVK
jgi:uncharacterized protein YdeI (BOF family)